VTRLAAIVRREYLERVRTRSFVIGTLVAPVLLSGFMLGPSLLAARQRGQPLRIAVVDAAGPLQQALEKRLAGYEEDGQRRFRLVPAGPGAPEGQRRRLREDVLAGRLDGYVYVPPDGFDGHVAQYHGRNVSNFRDLGALRALVNEAALGRRLEEAGIAPAALPELTTRMQLTAIKLSRAGEREDRGGSFLFAIVLLMALYTSVAMWGAAVMNGVIEEKSSRVAEVMVSSLAPATLFAGKLLGIGGAGLTQFLAWAALTGLVGSYGAQAALLGGVQLPEISLVQLCFFVLFFLLGYFLYAALYAIVGAAVNSTQEAQSLVFPVMMPLIVGFVACPVVASRPDSTLAVVMSLVPFWTPLLMFLRVATLTPPAWQVALSIVLTLATIGALNWAAARVYRVGILMYGKRATLPEILRWVRVG
jgi:ABC-2 type transport system permease protein